MEIQVSVPTMLLMMEIMKMVRKQWRRTGDREKKRSRKVWL